ncbi:RNase H domain-containing protein [Trichonephila clavipes]|nr:RNase H domain-containing protein [Trichonephila clavipes]
MDCRSYIQPLSNWPSIGDRTRRSVLRPFQQLSDWDPILLQWVPSHVGQPGNEVADDLANVAASNPVDLEDHMVLTSTKIYSRAKVLIFRTWVVPPVQPLYFQSHPGSAISFKGCRSYQTAFLLFSTGRLRVQLLQPDDHQQRVAFVQWLVNQSAGSIKGDSLIGLYILPPRLDSEKYLVSHGRYFRNCLPMTPHLFCAACGFNGIGHHLIMEVCTRPFGLDIS